MNRDLITRAFVLAILTAGAAPALCEDKSAFQQAMPAIGSNEVATDLQYLESAIADDPESLQYASEYRQVCIRHKDFDRSINYFTKLTSEHPNSGNLHLNRGFALVDKVPVVGSITQVLLANSALEEFSKAVELQPTWLALYTRGASYLFWPKVFNRASLGIADLERALAMQEGKPRRSYYVRAYIALGDGYCKADQFRKARAVWQQGLHYFPQNADLKTRLALSADAAAALINNSFDPNKRVNTDLRELWSDSRDQ